MAPGRPAWLRALVNEHDVEPRSIVAETALEMAFSSRGKGKSTSRQSTSSSTTRAPLPPFDKDLVCKHCGKAFRRVCNYREHQRVHSNEYKFNCPMQGCDRKFMWRSSIQAHLRSHQSKFERRRRVANARPRTANTGRDVTISKPRLTKLAPFSPTSPMVTDIPYFAPTPPRTSANTVPLQPGVYYAGQY